MTPAASLDPAAARASSRARAALGLCALFGAALAAWLTHGPAWFLTLPANLVHVLGALAALAVPLALGLRRAGGAAFAAGFAIALAAVLGPRWISAPEVVRADEGAPPALRVLTYNLGAALADGEAFAEGVLALDVDVVALEELSFANAEIVAERLGGSHPHQVLHPAGIPGRGLVSRYPIVAAEYLELTQVRKHLAVTLDILGRRVTVLVLHLSLKLGVLGARTAAARDLETLLERYADAGPLVVCGDFNTTEQSDVWKRMRAAGFEDAFRATGRGAGFTFPIFGRYRELPVPRCVRIDYVWHTREFRARRAWVGPDWGSDHRPVIADLDWAVPAPTARAR